MTGREQGDSEVWSPKAGLQKYFHAQKISYPVTVVSVYNENFPKKFLKFSVKIYLQLRVFNLRRINRDAL